MPTEQAIIDAINKAKKNLDKSIPENPEEKDNLKEDNLIKENISIKGKDSTGGDEESLQLESAPTVPGIEPKIYLGPDKKVTLTCDMLQALINGRAAQQNNQLQDQLRKLQESNQELAEALQKEKDAREKERIDLQKRLEEEIERNNNTLQVLAEFGPSAGDFYDRPISAKTPPFISTERSRTMHPDDAYREFNQIYNDSVRRGAWIADSTNGKISLQIDSRKISKFIRNHREILRDGMERFAKKHGFLRGMGGSGMDAPTTLADVPPLFLEYLSQVVRLEHTPTHILWQFSNRTINTGIAPGQSILVPRIPHISGGSSASHWILTPGTATNSGSQPITATAEPIIIRENGMGGPNNLPVAVPEFITANALIELESVLRQRIGFNYAQWEDLAHQELWFSTTNVVYNNNNSIVFAANQVNSGGQLTIPFLGQLYSYLSGLNIPTYPDGCYGYACPPSHIGQLQADAYSHHQYISPSNLEDLSSMFASVTNNNEIGRMSGYIGKISGFHIFQGSSFSTGPVGSPGVSSETTGNGTRTMRVGFAFGPDSIGWATAMPMTLRRDNNDDFGRLSRIIWISHEGYGALDIDPNRSGGSGDEQLRVIEVRMADLPV